MRLRCLVRLISLVRALHRRLRRLLLGVGRRRGTSVRDLRVLRRVDAAGAVEGHALHLVGEVCSLLLLEMGRWWLGIRLVATGLPLLGWRHACHGVSVVDGRFVAAAGEFLRVAGIQRVDAVGADLALEATWVADGGWRWCAGSGVGV